MARTKTTVPQPTGYTVRLFESDIPVYYHAPYQFFLAPEDVAEAVGIDPAQIRAALPNGLRAESLIHVCHFRRIPVRCEPFPRQLEFLEWSIRIKDRAHLGLARLHSEGYSLASRISPALKRAYHMHYSTTAEERELILGSEYPGYLDIEKVVGELVEFWRSTPGVKSWLLNTFRDQTVPIPSLPLPASLKFTA